MTSIRAGRSWRATWTAPVALASTLRCLIALVVAALCASAARAEPAGADRSYSRYERETLAQVLGELDATVDPKPEGKRIEAVIIRVLDVIEERDPAPNFLNIFHASSRQHTISRELLVTTGQPYRQDLVSESERNLRDLRQLSLVLVVPLRTPTKKGEPASVRLLVIAKDVWSLRLNSDYRFKNGQLEYLFLQPSEENLAGTHRRILAAFSLEPDAFSVGLQAIDPRLAGSRHIVGADANVIINRESGEPEGSFGYFQYGEPLYSTQQRWSWGGVIQWHDEITRRHVGVTLRTYDAAATVEQDAIPYVYDSSIIAGRFSVTRSFGSGTKHDVQVGVEASRKAFHLPDLRAYDPAAVAEFSDTQLPVSDTRNGPYVQYHLHLNSFRPLLDAETLALQEDFQLGPDLYLRCYPSAEIFGSTRNVIGGYAGYAHSLPLGDGLARGYLAATVETDLREGVIADASLQGGLRLISPRSPIGRLIYDGTILYRPANFLNQRISLGGDGRLRGYPSAMFIGQNLIASNLELRSRSFQLWTVLIAGVLFYDVGDAFSGFDSLEPKQGAGFGLRVLFPQIGRAVMRVDWGFALTPQPFPISVFDGLVLTFQQAFDVPQVTGTGVRLGLP